MRLNPQHVVVAARNHVPCRAFPLYVQKERPCILRKNDLVFYMCICGCLIAAIIVVSFIISGTAGTQVAQTHITHPAQAY